MKQIFILVIIALLTGPLFAEEAVLIDFSMLKADIIKDEKRSTDNKEVFLQNEHTMMDFKNIAGASFTKDQKDVMKTSLAIENWEVILSSSARSVENIRLSYTREAQSKGYWGEKEGRDEKDTIVMGVRVHFPVESFNAWAHIKPPFDIPAFEPLVTYNPDTQELEKDEASDGINTPSRFETQSGKTSSEQEDYTPAYGVIKNVGTIREIEVNAYSLNFPHGLYVVLIDSDGNSRNYFLGYINQNRVEGWQPYRWRNPQYVNEVAKRSLRLYPLYPYNTPFIKFGGFIIQRDATMQGGDFIGYFRDVRVIFDRAVLTPDRDIDDESLWNIINVRETARKTWEMARFGQDQVLRYLEDQKQAKQLPFNDPARNTTSE